LAWSAWFVRWAAIKTFTSRSASLIILLRGSAHVLCSDDAFWQGKRKTFRPPRSQSQAHQLANGLVQRGSLGLRLFARGLPNLLLQFNGHLHETILSSKAAQVKCPLAFVAFALSRV